jgi:hypothetical protein
MTLGQFMQDPETAKMRQKTLISVEYEFFMTFEKESLNVMEKD